MKWATRIEGAHELNTALSPEEINLVQEIMKELELESDEDFDTVESLEKSLDEMDFSKVILIFCN